MQTGTILNLTRLGVVRLVISDLDRSVRFYEDVLGLQQVTEAVAAPTFAGVPDGARRAVLAAPGSSRVLVELFEDPSARPVTRPASRLGLFHFAILLPDRASLGRFLAHLADLGIQPGAGDHLVSEALYVSDPDGLGIEVYADRPRESWQRRDGELLMATDPLDLRDLLAAGAGGAWREMPADSVMGHVHLHVGRLPEARAFYADALGFEITTERYPGALFMSAGGYHHHLGTNTWARGASPAGAGDARLLEWGLELPAAEDVAAAADRLEAAGHAVRRVSGDVVTADPWGTPVRLSVAG
jgi:catechol 2,3-dioxygenase